MKSIQQWNYFEWRFSADVSGWDNPFTQIHMKVTVESKEILDQFDGFYDGNGIFCFRYMPRQEGEYQFSIRSNFSVLNGQTGSFSVTAPSSGDHGPVTARGMHFYHADGTPCFIMGTTAYAWHYRPEEIRRQTLNSFSECGFNKIRMLFFPKQYSGGFGAIDVSYEPPCYPFEGQPKAFDFTRPNPEYFAAFEQRVMELRERGIIADVILFHPYDSGHWDLDAGMDQDDAIFYVRYMVARLAAFENVWWSLANEYDVDPTARYSIGKERREWDVIGELIHRRDPSHHPISCHNISFGWIYPNRPWMSHVSYQHPDTYTLMLELQREYQKPVIDDEYQYEGNTPDDWGNSSAELTLERHWLSVMTGGYATHGECYIRDNNRDIFWSYGGKFTGESAPRLRFLREIVEKCPFDQMKRDQVHSDSRHFYCISKDSDFYLMFMRDDLGKKVVWAGDWTTQAGRHQYQYRMTRYDVWNCKKIEETILPPGSRVPVTAWTAVTLERI